MLKTKTTLLRWLVTLLAPAALCAGESEFVALRPLYTTETAVLNPALVDLWSNILSFRVEPDGHRGYVLKDPTDEQEIGRFHLVQLGGETVADVVFGDVQPLLLLQLPVHCFARVRVEGGSLHVAWLGTGELARQIERTGLPRHERLQVEGRDDDFVVLTASSAELRKFLLDCLKLPDAFGDPGDFERAGPQDRAADLNGQSRHVAIGQASREAYAAALKQAEEAARLVPGEPAYWSTLGAAQYRAGFFNEALAALARAAQLRKSATPEDLIFRAMAHLQLGQTAEAKAALGEASELLRDPRSLGELERYCGDQDSRNLIHEAEDLIAAKGK
jgi:hypothetical protein